MSFDPKTDAAEIPENGERLNQTVKEVGLGKSYKPATGEKEEACIVKTVVDNGERVGKSLSFPLFQGDNTKYEEFQRALSLATPSTVLPKDMARNLQDAIGGRFQASVSLVPFETEKGKYVRYRQTFFTEAEGDSQIEIKTEPTQFRR